MFKKKKKHENNIVDLNEKLLRENDKMIRELIELLRKGDIKGFQINSRGDARIEF